MFTQVWADLDSGGAVTDRYVHWAGVDQILARVRLRDGGGPVSQPFYYLTDRQNTVLEVVSAGGTRVKSNRYIGTSVAQRMDVGSSALADRFEYTGRDFEERIGLQYTRARWLHNATGRFVSEDSLPDTVTGDANPYRYVKNSAANATDPSGHVISWLSAGVGAAVGAGLGVAGELISSAITGEEVTWGKVAGAATSGAISGAFAGAALGALSGDVSGVIAFGALTGAGILGGAAGGAAGSAVQQKIDDGSVDWGKVGTAAYNGAIGGAIGGVLGAGAGAAVGRWAGLKAADAVKCTLTRGQIAAHAASNAVSGGLAGAATDAAMQAMDPDLKGFSWSRVLAAGVNGAIGGAAGYFQNRAMNKSCFAAGTPLLVRGPGGELRSKRIEDVAVGDAVLSRDEYDPEGGCEWKRVEETFRRFAETLELHLAGGVRIGTTGEHPFFVPDRLAVAGSGAGEHEGLHGGTGGETATATVIAEVERVACGEWLPAWELRPGDALVGHDGRRVGVEGVRETGLWEPVYNLRVADYHTYFVGCDEWGFSVWAHNSYGELHTAAQAGFLDAATGLPVLSRRQTSGILSSALRHGNGDHVATAQRIAQSLEERGLPLTVADQRAAAFVEAALEGHFTPAQIAEASFMLRGNAIHADFTARVAAGGGPAVVHPGANPADFWNGVFPANRRDHVLMGEVHHSTHPTTGAPVTSATGLHHTAGGGGMITGPATAGPNAVGIGRYPVSIIDQATGIAYPKTNGGGKSTLFPASWSQGRVVSEIYAAFLDRTRISTSTFHGSHTWEGPGFTPGLRVQGYEFITPPAGLPAGIRSGIPAGVAMIQINFSTGPHGRLVGTTVHPYEAVGDFLTMEAYNRDCWPCNELVAGLARIFDGTEQGFDFGGDAYEVHANTETISVDLVIDHPPLRCPVPLNDFYESLLLWCRMLEQQTVV